MKRLLGSLMTAGLVLLLTGTGFAEPKIQGMTVEYRTEGAMMKGYLAYDESVEGKRPGVLVVPEWWGLNDYVRMRAKMLVELGYVALAVDMYGDGKVVTTPEEAGKLASEVSKNLDLAKARFAAALDFLKQQPLVDSTRIAAIGYCFGGGVVLNMARLGVDLKGVASFHGSLAPIKPAQPGMVRAKVLVLNGADDKFIPPEQIEAFNQEMKSAGVEFKFISYPGAVHSFTNPEATDLGKKFNMAVAYNAEADHKSWDEMKEFFNAIFKK